MKMFEINNNFEDIKKIQVKNSTITIVDDFYKNPDLILNNLILKSKLELHNKPTFDNRTYNLHYFFDRSFQSYIEEMDVVVKKIEEVSKQKLITKENFILNVTRLKSTIFNEFDRKYWWPHKDEGATSLVYFNKENIAGTNFYEDIQGDQIEIEKNNEAEHFHTWREKSKYNLLHTVEAKFNRLILFDGKELLHGAAFVDYTYFNIDRINQVLFFNEA